MFSRGRESGWIASFCFVIVILLYVALLFLLFVFVRNDLSPFFLCKPAVLRFSFIRYVVDGWSFIFSITVILQVATMTYGSSFFFSFFFSFFISRFTTRFRRQKGSFEWMCEQCRLIYHWESNFWTCRSWISDVWFANLEYFQRWSFWCWYHKILEPSILNSLMFEPVNCGI